MDFNEVLDFNNLYTGYLKCRKGKAWKNSTSAYQIDATYKTWKLRHELLTKKYKMDDYNVFPIFQPKPRTIKSISFEDKVVQRSLCDNVLSPIFESILFTIIMHVEKGKAFTRESIERKSFCGPTTEGMERMAMF